MVGQTLRCPGCKATFTAGASAPPPIRHQEVVTERKAAEPPPQGPSAYPPPRQRRFVREDDQEADWGEEPPQKLAGEDIEAWRSVQSGLSLHLMAHYLYLGGVGLIFLMFLLALAATPREPGSGSGFLGVLVTILMVIALLALLCNWIMAMVSTCYWLLAPARQGARAMGIACLVLTSLVLLEVANLFQVFELLAGRARETVGLPVGQFSLGLLEISRLTVLPFFLRALATNFRQSSLASMTMILAIATPATIVGVGLLNFLLIMVARSGAVFIIMMVLNFLGYLGVLFLGVLVLMRGRSLLRAQLRRAAG
jgi:hypothetical protein